MRIRIAPLLATAAVIAACGGEDRYGDRMTLGEEAPPRSGLPAELQTPIDEGNAAYRAKDYALALEHYLEATRRAPGEPTGWFGVVMAADALGQTDVAEQARARIQQLAPDLSTESHTSATPGGHP